MPIKYKFKLFKHCQLSMKKLTFDMLTYFFLCTPASGIAKAFIPIQTVIHSQVCKKKQPVTGQNLWENHIYNSQVSVLILKSKSGDSIRKEELKAEAKAYGKRLHHEGTLWGMCNASTGWVASMPIATPLKFSDPLILPKSALTKHCKNYAVEFGPAVSGFPLKIGRNLQSIPLSNFPDGYIGIYCYPKVKGIGPQMVYLIPTNQSMSFSATSRVDQYKPNQIKHAFHRWLNETRASNGLTNLESNDFLNQAAAFLAQRKNLTHERSKLSSAAKILNKKGFFLVGENRIQGSSINEIFKLLWTSPSHRRLLLSNSEFYGISIQATRKNIFVVFLAARSQPTNPNVSRIQRNQKKL